MGLMAWLKPCPFEIAGRGGGYRRRRKYVDAWLVSGGVDGMAEAMPL
jgi:hypothetical protein